MLINYRIHIYQNPISTKHMLRTSNHTLECRNGCPKPQSTRPSYVRRIPILYRSNEILKKCKLLQSRRSSHIMTLVHYTKSFMSSDSFLCVVVPLVHVFITVTWNATKARPPTLLHSSRSETDRSFVKLAPLHHGRLCQTWPKPGNTSAPTYSTIYKIRTLNTWVIQYYTIIY